MIIIIAVDTHHLICVLDICSKWFTGINMCNPPNNFLSWIILLHHSILPLRLSNYPGVTEPVCGGSRIWTHEVGLSAALLFCLLKDSWWEQFLWNVAVLILQFPYPIKASLRLLRPPTSYALHQAKFKVLDSLSCFTIGYLFSCTSWVSSNSV